MRSSLLNDPRAKLAQRSYVPLHPPESFAVYQEAGADVASLSSLSQGKAKAHAAQKAIASGSAPLARDEGLAPTSGHGAASVDLPRNVRTARLSTGAPARSRIVGLLLLMLVPTSVSADALDTIGLLLFGGGTAAIVGAGAWYYLEGGHEAPPNETRDAIMIGGLIAFGISLALYIGVSGTASEAVDVLKDVSESYDESPPYNLGLLSVAHPGMRASLSANLTDVTANRPEAAAITL